MKKAMTALAVVFLAGGAPALAAPGEDDAPTRAERNADRPHFDERPRGGGGERGGGQRGGGGERRDGDGGGFRQQRDADRVREAPRPPDAPRAVEAPRPPEAPRADAPRRRDRVQVPGDSVGRPGPWTPGVNDGGRNRGGENRGSGDGRRDGDRGDRRDGDRRDWTRGDNDRRDGDRGTWERRDGDRRDGDRRDGDRRYGDRRDGDRRGDRDGRRQWESGRYPHSYFSSHRYHRSWRPPAGYYFRLWSFGDFLPRSWYGPEYYITDPWNYDLPLAPPGYDWVRVGDDALLIDRYTGRVVQVVRSVFW